MWEVEHWYLALVSASVHQLASLLPVVVTWFVVAVVVAAAAAVEQVLVAVLLKNQIRTLKNFKCFRKQCLLQTGVW